VIGWTEVIF